MPGRFRYTGIVPAMGLVALAFATACGDGGNVAGPPPNEQPTAAISSPQNGGSFVEGTSVSFEGSATDAEDGVLTGNALAWTSSLDGPIGAGTSFTNGALSVGGHAITLRATDSRGASGATSVAITVTARPPTNQSPRATITSPPDGASYEQGAAVAFAGAGIDPEDGELPGSALRWESSLDGPLGGGASILRDDLSLGGHAIRLIVTDSQGAADTATVAVTIDPFNAPPSVDLTAPVDGTSVVERTSVTFEGSATDPEDGPLAGNSLQWSSSLDGPLGSGPSLARDDLSAGVHAIRLIGTDSGGKSDTAAVSLTVTPRQPPSAEILAPADGAAFQEGVSISFQGAATDPEDGTLTGASLIWTSSLNGQIGTGASVSRADLDVGPHTIRLIATDGDGMADTASVSITVTSTPPPNQRPATFITSPADGSSFQSGTSISFQGMGNDPEDGALTGASLVWRSSRDGQLGTGTSFSRNDLTAGAHVIRLIGTDGQGLADTSGVTITVTQPNQPPSASISAPSDGASFAEGASIAFTGSATDPEEGALGGASLVWRSSLDGQLGTGTSFSRSDLTAGDHVVRLIATDSQGRSDTAAVSIVVEPPPNQSPSATIASPANGSSFALGDPIAFRGSAADPEDGALLAGALVWSSSRDGALGTDTLLVRSDLSAGTHLIRLVATDSQGSADTASVSITVTNEAPTATILSPANGSDFTTGETISFQGFGTDPEDGTLTGGALVWESSRDGQIGTGGSFSRSDLSNGTHDIRLIARDTQGAADTAAVSVMISHPSLPGYQIHVRYANGTVPTSAQQQAVDEAVARWEELVTGDLPDINPNRTSPFSCGGVSVSDLREDIDDVIIYIEFAPIDGAGGTLGFAGPCLLRGGGGLPLAGGMRFDSVDLSWLGSAGLLDEVILHEVAHVMGIGTLWANRGFLQDPSDGNPGADTHFDGPQALAAFDSIGGTGYTDGAKVPVENDTDTYGPGSLDGHWRESVFSNELMSPSINGGVANPISLVTVESLEDIGYVVDPDLADAFILTFGGGWVLQGTRVELGGDVWRGPILEVDEQGRVGPP